MIGTLRRELVDKLLIVSEHHLRQVLDEYLRHYNTARPHRALGQIIPVQAGARPPEPVGLAERQIRRKQLLGGLIHEYYIAALPSHAATEDAGHPAELRFRAPQDPGVLPLPALLYPASVRIAIVCDNYSSHL